MKKKEQSQKKNTKLNVNGNSIDCQTQIRNEQTRFYSTLYKSKKTTSSSTDFFNHNINKLTNTENNKCEGKINDYECGLALKQMQNAKSPGSDGITVEFYQIFWGI